MNIDIDKYKTIIIDEAFFVFKNKDILEKIRYFLTKKEKTIIVVFQLKEDARQYGICLNELSNIKRNDLNTEKNIELYKMSICGSGMSFINEY